MYIRLHRVLAALVVESPMRLDELQVRSEPPATLFDSTTVQDGHANGNDPCTECDVCSGRDSGGNHRHRFNPLDSND